MENEKLAYAKRYDASWKDVIEELFSHFFVYFFPDYCDEVDWSIRPEFLDTELRSIGLTSEIGELRVDKLIRIQLKTGKQKTVFIHLEVQDRKATNFEDRMLNYWCRLRLHYGGDVLSMALLTDSDPSWSPHSCLITGLGFKGGIEFPVAKLTNCDTSESALKSSQNPFTLVAYAHKLAKETPQDFQRRYQIRKSLHILAAQKHWKPRIVVALMRFWDWVLYLPPNLNQALNEELHEMDKEGHMRISPAFEDTWRDGLEEGREEGLEEGHKKGRKEGHKKGRKEGRKEGLQEGKTQGAIATLNSLLENGSIDKDVHAKLMAPLKKTLATFYKKL